MPHFDNDLLEALKKLDPGHFPLKQLAQHSGLFEQETLKFSILNSTEQQHELLIKLSVFYQEISTTCPCSGQEAEKIDGHCVMLLTINKADALATFSIID